MILQFLFFVLLHFEFKVNCRKTTKCPSSHPSGQPSANPTSPTGFPTIMPTLEPSAAPSKQPSTQPSIQPSNPSCQVSVFLINFLYFYKSVYLFACLIFRVNQRFENLRNVLPAVNTTNATTSYESIFTANITAKL